MGRALRDAIVVQGANSEWADRASEVRPSICITSRRLLVPFCWRGLLSRSPTRSTLKLFGFLLAFYFPGKWRVLFKGCSTDKNSKPG